MISEEDEKFKQAFIEAWDTYMEPLIESGKVVFECSPTLREHLLKAGRYEYTDDEMWDLMESGEM